MNKLLAVDCDDVLLDWIHGFAQFASAALSREITGRPGSWDMSAWLGVTVGEAASLIEAFNASPAFGDLGPSSAAEHVVPHLAAEGYRFAVITSCSDDAMTSQRRRDNLERHFGDIFHSVTCLPLGISKTSALAAIDPTHWVEDNYLNALLGTNYGHKSIMIRKPHNTMFEHDDALCHWVDDWFGVLAMLPSSKRASILPGWPASHSARKEL